MKQAHVFVVGSVHGVGYRFFVKSWAETYGIVGWVANLDDGRVEGVFQGKQGEVEKLIRKCWKGPFLAEVKDIVVSWEETGERYGDFRVAS